MQKDTLWTSLSLALKKTLNEVSYTNWIEPLVPISIENKVLLLKASNSISVGMLDKMYKSIMLEQLQMIDVTMRGVSFTLLETGSIDSEVEILLHEDETTDTDSEEIAPPKAPLAPRQKHQNRLINDSLTFGRFYTGGENEFALNAAQVVAKEPGRKRFNPLYIYGGIGMGKTHLIQAIANSAHEQHPKLTVVYVTADEFYYGFSTAAKERRIDDFLSTFLKADILLIDELHRFSGRVASQIELFKIFNELHLNNKQIVFTAHQPPEQLEGFEDRLISRFQWGLSVGILPPKLATRRTILQGLVERENLDINSDILDYITKEGPANIRAMEGVVIRLLAQASFSKKDITIGSVETLLDDLQTREKRSNYTAGEILRTVSDYYDIGVDSIKSASRTQEVALARQVAMYLSKKYTNLGFKAIGAELGNKNHSTVIHGVKAIDLRKKTDANLKAALKAIEHTLLKNS